MGKSLTREKLATHNGEGDAQEAPSHMDRVRDPQAVAAATASSPPAPDAPRSEEAI